MSLLTLTHLLCTVLTVVLCLYIISAFLVPQYRVILVISCVCIQWKPPNAEAWRVDNENSSAANVFQENTQIFAVFQRMQKRFFFSYARLSLLFPVLTQKCLVKSSFDSYAQMFHDL